MSDFFISYKREDEGRVEALQRALRDGGLDVWWDKEIRGGDQWRARIQSELEAAKCVVVVWSETSTGPLGDFVIDEANRGKQRGVLLQVRIDDVALPLGFGEHQALNLVGWRGDVGDPRVADVVGAVKAKVSGGPMPVPLGLKRRARNRALMVSAVAVGLVGFLLAMRVQAVRGLACGVPGLRGLVAHSEPQEVWEAEERRLPLVVRAGLTAFPTEDAARSDALIRAGQEAQDICGGFAQGDFRLRLTARAVGPKWDCQRHAGGYFCGFSGQAVCPVNVRYQRQVEACP
jgi:hypothetical protein